ncbi:hypothetical protein LX16_3546 [Stackebrandtia albiflava]|uniref:Uncharacterized protein n=1 Tax=Stackebrandtia albiflava TaxID=406432 RepID=A0A562V4M6_9ACTN|nr:TMEM198/TM7SF3 family protein [Stackebrandtia albiflava]TWJ12782.1 hypothetical protein LX16_3546 [Stackebrandtia albiflava]
MSTEPPVPATDAHGSPPTTGTVPGTALAVIPRPGLPARREQGGPAARSPQMAAYQAACRAYADAVTAAHLARTDAEDRYRREVESVRQTASRAVAARESAVRAAEEARALVAEADEAAHDVWRRLAMYTGRRSPGITPPPDDAAECEDAARVRALLTRSRRAIALAQRGELPFPPPRHALPVAIVVGIACGLAALWGAGLLLGAASGGSSAQAAIQAAALVVLFLGAFAAIPVVTGWLAVRHRMGVRPAHIAACVLGSVAAICGLAPVVLL